MCVMYVWIPVCGETGDTSANLCGELRWQQQDEFKYGQIVIERDVTRRSFLAVKHERDRANRIFKGISLSTASALSF